MKIANILYSIKWLLSGIPNLKNNIKVTAAIPIQIDNSLFPGLSFIA